MDGIFKSALVRSLAGRDKGRHFVVVDVIDENYVNICDGDLRRVDKPKRKKIKHLSVIGQCGDFVAQKLLGGTKCTNNEIRKSIAETVGN